MSYADINGLEDKLIWWALAAMAALALASVNAVAEETVKVGLILPMTGPFSDQAQPQFGLMPTTRMAHNGVANTRYNNLGDDDCAI